MMVENVVRELQVKLFEVITNDVELRNHNIDVYDHVLPNMAYPYLTIGNYQVKPYHTNIYDGYNIIWEANLYIKDKNNQVILGAIENIKNLLTINNINLTNFSVKKVRLVEYKISKLLETQIEVLKGKIMFEFIIFNL